MGLIICPECKRQISDTADACPNCGFKLTPAVITAVKEKQKKAAKSAGIGCLTVVLVFFLIIFLTPKKQPDPPAAPKTKQELRTEKIIGLFSSWDGSLYELNSYIKKNLNDPKSFEHVKTTYSDYGSYLVVKTVYRGKNAFGALVVNSITAQVDLNGNPVKIISTEP